MFVLEDDAMKAERPEMCSGYHEFKTESIFSRDVCDERELGFLSGGTMEKAVLL